MGLTGHGCINLVSMEWLFVLITFCLSVVLTSAFLPGILKVSHKKRLYDEADERKVHAGNIPRLGGLSFLPVVLFACLLCIGIYLLSGFDLSIGFRKVMSQIAFFVCGSLLLYLIGVRDDLVGLRYRTKFYVQFLVASFLPLSGLWLKNLNGLFGIYEIAPWLGIPFTILLVVLIINAMNFIDGVDGLAAGISVVSLIILSTLFVVSQMWGYALISVTTIGVLLPFIYYNVYGKAEQRKKLFMGDTGSLTLGYLLAYLCLSLSTNISIVAPHLSRAPLYMVAFSTLFIPMFDVVRVMIVRIAHHQSPFLPDRNHIHHVLLAKGFSTRQTAGTIILITYLYGIFNIFCLSKGFDINLIFLANLLSWIALNIWLMKGHKAQAASQAQPAVATQEVTPPTPKSQVDIHRKEKRA